MHNHSIQNIHNNNNAYWYDITHSLVNRPVVQLAGPALAPLDGSYPLIIHQQRIAGDFRLSKHKYIQVILILNFFLSLLQL